MTNFQFLMQIYYHFMFKKIKDNTDIKLVNVNNFKCENASINFFLRNNE